MGEIDPPGGLEFLMNGGSVWSEDGKFCEWWESVDTPST